MEAVRTSRDGPRLAVEALGSTVAEACADVGEDAIAMGVDRLRKLDEGSELGCPCPLHPLVELGRGDVDLAPIEHGEQALLEQVCTVDPLVGAFEERELLLLEAEEVPGVLLQRPASALEFLLFLGRCLADFVATDFVQSVMGEALNVEPIEDQLGLGRRLGDSLDVGAGEIDNGPTIDVVALRAGVLGDGGLPGTAKAMAHLLQQGTPREAETTSKRMNRLPYSRSSIERIGHAVGELYVERRLDIEEELADDLAVPREAKSVSIALDRVALPMEEIVINAAAEEQVTRVWHMAHVGALTLHDGAGKALHTVRYACMPEGDIEGIGESLHADLAHVLGQRPQLTVVKLADGAPEMRRRLDEIAEGVADDAVDLLDFWHGVEKLGKAARAFTTEDAAKRTVSRWKGWLLNDAEAVARIRRELVEHRGRAAVDEAITYLDNQEHRMNYAAARAAGLPIGSGNVEASCKNIVRLRMVRGGSRWKRAPGERVLHLRALAQSDRWDEGIDLALKPLRKKVRHAA